jgi:hypothetical protein
MNIDGTRKRWPCQLHGKRVILLDWGAERKKFGPFLTETNGLMLLGKILAVTSANHMKYLNTV